MENLKKSNDQRNNDRDVRNLKQNKLKTMIFSSKEVEKNYTFKLFRKLVHITFSLFGFSLLFAPVLIKQYTLYLLYIMVISAIIVDTIRIYVPFLNKLVYRFLGTLFIERDSSRYSSGTFYLLGASIATILYSFDYQIAGMAIIYLGIGDCMASIFGIFLKPYIPTTLPKSNKTVIGFIAFIASTSLIGYFTHIPLWICFTAAVIAALTEVYLTFIDDNLSIPIIGGGCITLLLAI